MKNKLLGFLLSFFLILGITGSANALPWSWDFTSVGDGNTLSYNSSTPTGSSTVDFADFMGVINKNGLTTINQSFTGGADDTVLDDGDTFSEFGFLETINVDNLGTYFGTTDNGTFRTDSVYIQFNNLSGYISNYTSTDAATSLSNYTTNLADDSFNLNFTPGAGTITMYLDQDTNTPGGVTELASFDLLAGAGTSPNFYFANASEGNFGMQIGVTSVASNFWKFGDGTSFEDWMNAYGSPSIFFNSFNLGATFKSVTDDGTDLNISVFNHGDFHMSAVPEPATLVLLGFGLLGLAGIGKKARKTT